MASKYTKRRKGKKGQTRRYRIKGGNGNSFVVINPLHRGRLPPVISSSATAPANSVRMTKNPLFNNSVSRPLRPLTATTAVSNSSHKYRVGGQDLVKGDFYQVEHMEDLNWYGGVLKSIEQSRKDPNMAYLTFSPVWATNEIKTRYTLIPGEIPLIYKKDRQNPLNHILFNDGAKPYITSPGSLFSSTIYTPEFKIKPSF